MALRSALRPLLLGFLIPIFVRRTFDQCRRCESAFSSENAAGKWRRQWHPPGPAQLIALDFFFSICVHFCEGRLGGISYFRVRARMDRIVADPSLVDSQGGRLGKVSRAGFRPRSRAPVGDDERDPGQVQTWVVGMATSTFVAATWVERRTGHRTGGTHLPSGARSCFFQ